jgi:hypothetical protein
MRSRFCTVPSSYLPELRNRFVESDLSPDETLSRIDTDLPVPLSGTSRAATSRRVRPSRGRVADGADCPSWNGRRVANHGVR